MTRLLDADRPFTGDSAPPILSAVPRRGRGEAVITLNGEIDIASAGQIRAAVTECLRKPPPKSLVIDLTAVTFCDCSGVEALEWAHGLARTGRMAFGLDGVDRRLRRVFSLARADGLLNACRSAHTTN
jgi:anti-anti-sigma factor